MMGKRRLERIEKRWIAARNFEEADRVPVLINVGAPFYCQVLGYTLKDYYRSLSLSQKIQIEGSRWAYENLGDDRLRYLSDTKRIRPPTGSVSEGIIWDCRIDLPDEERPWLAPWIVPKFTTPESVEQLEIPDPKECTKRLQRHYLRAFGKGIPAKTPPTIHPPCSAAGSLLGAERLYIYLYRHPSLMHNLFRKLLKSYFVLRDYTDDQRGTSTTSIGLSDDHSGYLREDMYREFVLPYNKQIYEKYGAERRRLHMDSPTEHIAKIIRDEYKVDELDLGWQADIAEVKEALDGKVFFNGNMESRILATGTHQQIREAVAHCINAAAPGGGYFFDIGGETYAGIDVDRLKYAIEYAKKIGRYPLKKRSSLAYPP
jgi:uroporphyrinogen-III decarboxylase